MRNKFFIWTSLVSLFLFGCITKRYAYLENGSSETIYFYFRDMKDKSPIIKPKEKTIIMITEGELPKDKFISEEYNYLFFDTLSIVLKKDTLKYSDKDVREILNKIWISDNGLSGKNSNNSIIWKITDSIFHCE